MYIGRRASTLKPWRWHFRSILHLLVPPARGQVMFSLRLQSSVGGWRVWWGLRLFYWSRSPQLGHAQSCSHSNLSWAQVGSCRHQSQIQVPPTRLTATKPSWDISESADSALNQFPPFPCRTKNSGGQGHRGKPGTKEEFVWKVTQLKAFVCQRWHSSRLSCHEWSPEERTCTLLVL